MKTPMRLPFDSILSIFSLSQSMRVGFSLFDRHGCPSHTLRLADARVANGYGFADARGPSWLRVRRPLRAIKFNRSGARQDRLDCKSFPDLCTYSRLFFSFSLALVAWLYHICKLHMFSPFSHMNPEIQDSASCTKLILMDLSVLTQ